jgi:hypothetical protein
MYGNRLTREFGDSVPEPWQSAIRTLKDHEIQRGLRKLSLAGSASVPTLPVFMKACREAGGDDGEVRPAATFLPSPPREEFHQNAQFRLMKFLMANDVSEDTLAALVIEKNRLLRDFRDMARESDVTPDQVCAALDRAFERVYRQRAAA